MIRVAAIIIAIVSLVIQPLMAATLMTVSLGGAARVQSTSTTAFFALSANFSKPLNISGSNNEAHAHYESTQSKDVMTSMRCHDQAAAINFIQSLVSNCTLNCENEDSCSTTCASSYIPLHTVFLPRPEQQHGQLVIAPVEHFISTTRSRIYYPPRLS